MRGIAGKTTNNNTRNAYSCVRLKTYTSTLYVYTKIVICARVLKRVKIIKKKVAWKRASVYVVVPRRMCAADRTRQIRAGGERARALLLLPRPSRSCPVQASACMAIVLAWRSGAGYRSMRMRTSVCVLSWSENGVSQVSGGSTQ